MHSRYSIRQVIVPKMFLVQYLFLLLPLALAFDGPVPLSVRKALIEKSKAINPPETYNPVGWSNRAGTVLTPIQAEPGVYTGDRPFYWNDIDVSCRMAVVELPSGKDKPDLWIHSPVGLDGPTKAAIDKLGTVKYVVSPNYEHLKFVSEWFLAYPDAEFWGCPGLAARRQDIKWAGEVPAHYRPKGFMNGSGSPDPKGFWDTNIIEAMHIDKETNPFKPGNPSGFFEEVIYYHKPTKTLIVTDLWWNYPADIVPNSQFGRDDTWELAPKVDKIPLGSRAWKFGMDKIYHPFYNNFMVTDKTAYRDIANHIVNKWDIEAIIPAHGDIVRGKDLCTKILKEHFNLG